MDKNELKIVCIIDNYTRFKDLKTAFNNVNISKKHLNSHYFSKINKENPYLLMSKCSTPKLKNSVIESDLWDILLILDKSVDASNKSVFAKDVLVMWHKHAEVYINENVLEEKRNNGEIRQYRTGAHKPPEEYGYARLKYLIEAWEGSKFNPVKYDRARMKLIEWFALDDEKLDIALEFLHECLNGTSPSKTKLSEEGFDLNKTCNIGKAKKKTINQLIDDFNNTPGNIELLEALRDGILEMAGVK